MPKKKSVRNARIIALTDCHFAVISKARFLNMLNSQMPTEDTLKDFIKQIPEYDKLVSLLVRY